MGTQRRKKSPGDGDGADPVRYDRYLVEAFGVGVGVMGLRPEDFWAMTPAEYGAACRAFFKHRDRRERDGWRQTRWLAAKIINISGKSLRADIRPEDLLRFSDEPEAGVSTWTMADLERRRLETEADFKFHKAKFWTLLPDDITIPPVEESGNVLRPGDIEPDVVTSIPQ